MVGRLRGWAGLSNGLSKWIVQRSQEIEILMKRIDEEFLDEQLTLREVGGPAGP